MRPTKATHMNSYRTEYHETVQRSSVKKRVRFVESPANSSDSLRGSQHTSSHNVHYPQEEVDSNRVKSDSTRRRLLDEVTKSMDKFPRIPLLPMTPWLQPIPLPRTSTRHHHHHQAPHPSTSNPPHPHPTASSASHPLTPLPIRVTSLPKPHSSGPHDRRSHRNSHPTPSTSHSAMPNPSSSSSAHIPRHIHGQHSDPTLRTRKSNINDGSSGETYVPRDKGKTRAQPPKQHIVERRSDAGENFCFESLTIQEDNMRYGASRSVTENPYDGTIQYKVERFREYRFY